MADDSRPLLPSLRASPVAQLEMAPAPPPARRPKHTSGTPRTCRTCGAAFASGNALHAHLVSCKPTPSTTTRKRKAPEPAPVARAAPETYADAVAAPPAKQRRFTHRSLGGDVAAVERDGTVHYNHDDAATAHAAVAALAVRPATAPASCSPHMAWRRAN